ncbi:MAG: hypothetical protein PHN90_12515 [Methanothrix sp.]|nr:hypothetical protein [Methanothrix sp.]NLX38069.1 hypothetical protein [Methanothrix sp.]HNR58449.1 hypothetical protein [Methanothrix sp.]HNT72729.1 hypothetical protein [Methanothrix sp.]HOI70349.1 hypothetical protein [Methanothrix sp.]
MRGSDSRRRRARSKLDRDLSLRPQAGGGILELKMPRREPETEEMLTKVEVK